MGKFCQFLTVICLPVPHDNGRVLLFHVFLFLCFVFCMVCHFIFKPCSLSDLICKGIGYHHAGMDLQDRKSIEETFAAGDLPVLGNNNGLLLNV